MPIHLPPISRRKFLVRTLAAGALALASPSLFAKKIKRDEHSLYLLSDIHISEDATRMAHEINMADNLTTVGREIIEWPTPAAGVLISGDCAYNQGMPGDYETLTRLLRPMREAGLPIHLMLGNHDHRENFWSAIKEARAAKRPVHDRHASILKTERANWFMLDSLDKTKSTPGIVGESQREWLMKALDSNTTKPAIIVVHHNPHKGSLLDVEEMFAILRPRSQVKACVFGHTHHWDVSQEESGIHLINLPATSYVFQPSQPNGWVHAALAKDGMKLQLNCLDKKHRAHGETKELKWRV